jgi:hypothetical protein
MSPPRVKTADPPSPGERPPESPRAARAGADVMRRGAGCYGSGVEGSPNMERRINAAISLS